MGCKICGGDWDQHCKYCEGEMSEEHKMPKEKRCSECLHRLNGIKNAPYAMPGSIEYVCTATTKKVPARKRNPDGKCKYFKQASSVW